eukprot:GFUD01127557.1.p1 GENE.GFUD01127557.1~~GFUD01127557.1.p1  ORF type:complete len:150 (-),score=29.61 GFUD01127557.1:137-532(-)
MLHSSPSLLALVAVALFLASHSLQDDNQDQVSGDLDQVSGDLVPSPDGTMMNETISTGGGKNSRKGGAGGAVTTVSPSIERYCPDYFRYKVYSIGACRSNCGRYSFQYYYWYPYPNYRCYCCRWTPRPHIL